MGTADDASSARKACYVLHATHRALRAACCVLRAAAVGCMLCTAAVGCMLLLLDARCCMLLAMRVAVRCVLRAACCVLLATGDWATGYWLLATGY